MTTNNKKELILCDYCSTEKDATQIYSAKKFFAGCKIPDILHIVTRRTIPATIPIKLCSICVSTLLAATGTISKADEIVAKLLAGAPGKKQNIETDSKSGAHVGNVVIEAPSVGQPPAKKKPDIKNKAVSDATPNTSKANLLQTSTPLTAPLKLTNGTLTPASTPTVAPSTPNKQQCLDTILQNSVKLTPAKDEPKKAKAFIQLFGTSVNKTGDIDEDEEEDDEDDDDDDDIVQKSVPKNIAKNFECKNCDYTCVHAVAMKTHYKEMHGQKRPRIFNCLVCTKSFGRLATLKTHLTEHGLVEANNGKPVPVPVPELAMFTALKSNPSANGDDISFNVGATLSSTQKFTVKDQQKMQCEICQSEFTQVKVLQEHMTTVHNIARPKIFKCKLCLHQFMHKWSLDRHTKSKKHCNESDIGNTKPAKKEKVRRLTTEMTSIAPTKITKRRKTVAVELIAAEEPEVNVEKTTPAKQKKDESPEDLSEEDFNDILEKTFIDIVEEPTEHHIKAESATPSKRNAKENSQLAKSKIVTPKKQKSSVSEEIPSWASPIKQMPKENGKDIDIEPNTSTKKKKSKSDKDMLDSSQSATNETPKKSSKRKSDTQLENLTQEDTANTTAYDSSTKDIQNSHLETIDLMDEINRNVKPHKRSKLDSINESELSCTICTKVVPSRKRLDSHMQKRHATQLTCPNCNLGYTNNMDYVSHFASCSASGDVLPCGVQKCKKSFQTVHYLSSHLIKKHNVE